jgi:hypothetical protein
MINNITELAIKYKKASNIYWGEEYVNLLHEHFKNQSDTSEWIDKDSELIDEMDNTKKEIIKYIGNDKILFGLYLCFASFIIKEDYENAQLIKTKILNYDTKSR